MTRFSIFAKTVIENDDETITAIFKDGSELIISEYAEGFFTNYDEEIIFETEEDFLNLKKTANDLGIWTKLSEEEIKFSLEIAASKAERIGLGATEKQISYLTKLMFDANDNRQMDMPDILTCRQAHNQISQYTK